ncbi:MAG: septum formation initiator family protein [Verrucomicrobiae bacterium]|nr:septum formation initiator family protein [Verrucomicrobiae bacterium]
MAFRRLEVDYGFPEKIRKFFVGLVVVSLMLILGSCYEPTFKKMRNLQVEVEAKKKALAVQQGLHRRYQDRLAALRHDPEAVEREVREKFRLAKPEETIYRFDPASPPPR